MSKCGDLNRALPVQKNVEFYERRMAQDDYADNYGDNRKAPWYAAFTSWGKSQYDKIAGKENTISVAKQRAYLNKQYKKKEADRLLMLTQIEAMLESTPGVVPFFWKWVSGEMNMLDPKLMRQRFPEYEITTFPNKDGEMVPHLNTLPPDFLKVLHGELYHWINGGKFWKKKSGRFLDFQLEILTPRTVSRKDPSGLIAQTNAGLESWYNTAQGASAAWYELSSDGKRPGINTIAHKLAELTDSFGNLDTDVVWDMFFKYKRGQAFFKKGDDRLWVSTKWVQPKPGQPHRWVRSEDSITPYTWKDESFNEFEVPFSEQKTGAFSQSQKEMLTNSTAMLKDFYDGFFDTVQDITKIQNARAKKINRIAKENNTQHLVDEVTELGIIGDEIDIAGMTVVDKKLKYYMTRMYYQEQIPRLMEEALYGQTGMVAKRDMLSSKMREYDPTVEHTDEEIRKQMSYESRIDELNADIYILEEKINQFNDGLFDFTHNEYIQARHILKNFKRVTEMIHPKHARTDHNVLKDYVDTTFRTVHRNEVTLDLMEALASKGHLAPPGVAEYAINHYKSTFHFPDAKTTWMTLRTDAQLWSNRINKYTPFHTTPREIASKMKSISSYFIFQALSGPFQGLTNYSNFLLKIHDIGIERHTRFMDAFHKNPQFWFKLAEKNGVTQFTSFIEGHVQKELRPDEREVYKGEIKLLMKEIKDSERTKKYKRLIVLQKRLRSIKDKNVGSKLSGIAQWAITRRISHNKMDPIWLQTVKKMGEFYGQLPSIAQTEENLRVMSFGIGVLNYVERNPGEAFDSPGAIANGVDYTHRVDFGLSQHHVGMMGRGPIGGFLTRMRIWHMQRFGHDVNVYKKALREQSRPEMVHQNMDGEFVLDDGWAKRVGRTGMGYYGLMKGIATAPGPWAKNQRLDQKYTARARSHFWWHGLSSMVMDFAIFSLAPPGSGLITGALARTARIGFYRTPLGRGLNGFGSSYLSLIAGGIHLMSIMASGGFDEKEYTFEQFMQKYAYHMPNFGLGSSVMIDLVLWMSHNHRLDKARGQHSFVINHEQKVKNLVFPMGKTVHEAEEILKLAGVIEDDKEILEQSYIR